VGGIIGESKLQQISSLTLILSAGVYLLENIILMIL
jgi:hypothetical protein